MNKKEIIKSCWKKIDNIIDGHVLGEVGDTCKECATKIITLVLKAHDR